MYHGILKSQASLLRTLKTLLPDFEILENYRIPLDKSQRIENKDGLAFYEFDVSLEVEKGTPVATL
jgi:hypothetical protein